MMIVAALSGFVLGFAGSIPVAGPTAVVVMESALAHRNREGLEVAVGAAVRREPLCFGGLFRAIGDVQSISRDPALARGGRPHRDRDRLLLLASPKHVGLEVVEPAAGQARPWLGLGFTITALNPTLAVTWTAAVAALHSALPVTFTVWDAPIFAAGAGAGIVLWFWSMLKLVRQFQAQLGPTTVDHLIKGMGGALVMVGAFLAGRTLLSAGGIWSH